MCPLNHPNTKEIKDGIDIVTNIFEDMVIDYFKKNSFEGEPLTVLSALPPYNRVKILSEIWNENPKNELVIDKLSMAYLKNNEYDKAKIFISSLVVQGDITTEYAVRQLDKLELLKSMQGKLNSSKSVIDTAKIFKEILGEKKTTEYSDFEKMFFILVKGYISNEK